MSFEQFLQSGASPFVMENGQMVYRPEAQTVFPNYEGNGEWGDLMQGLGVAGLVFGAGFGLEALLGGSAVGGTSAAAGATGQAASAAAPGAFAESFAPTITQGTVAAANAVPGVVGPTAGIAQQAATLGAGGTLAAGTLPSVAGLSDAGVAAAMGAGASPIYNIGSAQLTVDAAGNIVDAAGNLANSVPGPGGPGTPSTPQIPRLPPTPPGGSPGQPLTNPVGGNPVTDAIIKAGVNALGGAIASGMAGDSGTSTAGLTNAQNNLNQVKMPSEAEAASRAHADVTQAFDVQRKNFMRNLQSYGINPASGRYAGTLAKFQRQEGKTDALSQNIARQGARNAQLGTAATLAQLQGGLVSTQAMIDANNFARQQAVANQARAGIAPIVSAVTPYLTKGVSNWFNLSPQQNNTVSDAADNIYQPDLVGV